MKEEKSPGLRQRRAAQTLFLAALVALCLLHAWLLRQNVKDMADDAMISARYAKNLADGRGLRYNLSPSSARPVEGYSNFLWVLGLAVGFRLQVLPRVTTALMGGGFALLTVIVLAFWVRRRTGSSLAGLAAALLLVLNRAWTMWAVQGLETAQFAALVLAAAAVASAQRPRPWEYLFALLAALSRPDGLLVFPSLLAASLLHRPRPWRRAALSALFFLLPYSLYCLWKLSYFGGLISNSFYAKTGLGLAGVKAGLFYLFSSFRLELFPWLLLVAGAGAVFRSHGARQELSPPFLFLLFYLLFIAAVGGDFMPDHRFLMHLLPLMIGTGAIGGFHLFHSLFPPGWQVAWFLPISGRRWAVWLVVLAAGSWLQQDRFFAGEEGRFNLVWHTRQAEWYGRVASWLARHAAREDSVAAGDIGYIGFVSGVDRMVDTAGLVDSYLARRRGAAFFETDPDYILSQRPAFVVMMVHYFDEGALVGHSAFDRALLARPQLLAAYELAAELPGWRGRHRSFADGRVRESAVRFRIYQRVGVNGEGE